MPLSETKVAIYDYDTTCPGYISLKQGDVVEEATEIETGWGQGVNRRTNQSGYFPWHYTTGSPGEQHKLPKISNQYQFFERNGGLLNSNLADAKTEMNSKSNCQQIPQNLEEMKLSEPLNKNVDEPSVRTTAGRNNRGMKRRTGRSHYYEVSSDDDEGTINVGSRLVEEGERYCDGEEIKAHQTRSMAVSIIVAVMVSILVFCKLHFHQEATVELSCAITGAILTLLMTSAIFSLRLRCACVLVLFTLFAREGQMLFFSMITSFLLNGPVTNIVYNAEQMSTSLSCYGDLAVQQGAVLQQHIEDTLNRSTLLLKAELEKVQGISDDLNYVMDPLASGFSQVKDGATKVQEEINRISQRCKESITASYESCMTLSHQCSKGRIERRNIIGDHIWDSIKDAFDNSVVKPLEGGKDAVCAEFAKMCEPLSIPGPVCSFTGDVLSDVGSGVGAMLKELETLRKNLGFELVFANKQHGGVEVSRNTSQIKSAIHQEIEDAFRLVFFMTNLLSLILFSLGISFVFYKAYSYIRHYMTQDKFDNGYVTAQLKQLDNKNSTKTKMFPLKKLECRRIIDLTSARLTKAERTAMIMSVIPFLLSLMATVGVIFVDNALYRVLSIVQRYGDVQVEVEGEASASFEIPSTGLLSNIMRACVKSFDLVSHYNVTMDLSLCVPQGRPPKSLEYYILALLYILTAAFIICQAYGLRTRHKVAAVFYPIRQNERLIYLYKSVKDSRKSYKRKAKRNAKLFAKENHLLANRSVLARLARVVPGLDRWLRRLRLSRQQCVNCQRCLSGKAARCPEHGSGNSCEGVMFCTDCSQDIDQICPVCKTKLMVNDKSGSC